MPRWFQCLFSRNLLLDSLKGTFVDFNLKNTIVTFLICSSLIKTYSVPNPVAVGETRHWSRIRNLSKVKPSSHRRHWWNFGAVPKVKSETSSSTQGFSKMGWQWLSQSYHWLASFLFKYARFLQLCSPEGALPEKWVRVFAALKPPFHALLAVLKTPIAAFLSRLNLVQKETMWSLILYVVCTYVVCNMWYVLQMHWCIPMGLGHNDPWHNDPGGHSNVKGGIRLVQKFT